MAPEPQKRLMSRWRGDAGTLITLMLTPEPILPTIHTDTEVNPDIKLELDRTLSQLKYYLHICISQRHTCSRETRNHIYISMSVLHIYQSCQCRCPHLRRTGYPLAKWWCESTLKNRQKLRVDSPMGTGTESAHMLLVLFIVKNK